MYIHIHAYIYTYINESALILSEACLRPAAKRSYSFNNARHTSTKRRDTIMKRVALYCILYGIVSIILFPTWLVLVKAAHTSVQILKCHLTFINKNTTLINSNCISGIHDSKDELAKQKAKKKQTKKLKTCTLVTRRTSTNDFNSPTTVQHKYLNLLNRKKCQLLVFYEYCLCWQLEKNFKYLNSIEKLAINSWVNEF